MLIRELVWVYLLGGVTFLPIVIVFTLGVLYWLSPTATSLNVEEVELEELIRRPSDMLQDDKSVKSEDEFEGVDASKHGWMDVTDDYQAGRGNQLQYTVEQGTKESNSYLGTLMQSYRNMVDSSSLDIGGGGTGGTGGTGEGEQKRQAKGRKRTTFFAVLKHGNLFLYQEEEQIDVKHVIVLSNFMISIFPPGGPDGQLWIKTSCICMSPINDMAVKTSYYLFFANNSDKEDWYLTLLRACKSVGKSNIPLEQQPMYAASTLRFEPEHMDTLLQSLQSDNDSHWLNALLGRIFLGTYKTSFIKEFFRAKIYDKIKRIKLPTYFAEIELKEIRLGDSMPHISNPSLRELTPDGNLTLDADVRYTGQFRVEFGTIATLQLGTRFKPRQVTLGIAVTFKKVEGKMQFRIKKPPSNRIWYGFYEMPQVELSIEPIVSSKQITYSVVLRTIENRIKEVIQDTLVMPNMDDTAFYPTTAQVYPGGIWKEHSTSPRTSLYDDTEHLVDSEDATAVIKSDVDEKSEAKVRRRMKTTLRKTPSMPASDILPLSAGRPTRSSSVSSVQSAPLIEEDKDEAPERSMANAAAVHVFRSDTALRSLPSSPPPINVTPNSTASVCPTGQITAASKIGTVQGTNSESNGGNDVKRTARYANSLKDKDLSMEKLLSPSLATVSATKDAVKRWGANYMAKRQGKDISRQAVAASLRRDRENKLVNSQKPNTHQPGDELVLPRSITDEDDPDNGPMAFHRSSQADSGRAAEASFPAYAASMMTIPGVSSSAQVNDAAENATYNMSRRKPVPSQQQTANTDDTSSSSLSDDLLVEATNTAGAANEADVSVIKKEEQPVASRRRLTNDSVEESVCRLSTDSADSEWQQEDPGQSSLKDDAEHQRLQY